MSNLNHQRGFLNLDGILSALIIFGIVIGLFIAAITFFVVPEFWALIKPWLHEVTK